MVVRIRQSNDVTPMTVWIRLGPSYAQQLVAAARARQMMVDDYATLLFIQAMNHGATLDEPELEREAAD